MRLYLSPGRVDDTAWRRLSARVSPLTLKAHVTSFVQLQGPGVERLIYGSSVGVYGLLNTLPADETREPHPNTPYRVSKL